MCVDSSTADVGPDSVLASGAISSLTSRSDLDKYNDSSREMMGSSSHDGNGESRSLFWTRSEGHV